MSFENHEISLFAKIDIDWASERKYHQWKCLTLAADEQT